MFAQNHYVDVGFRFGKTWTPRASSNLVACAEGAGGWWLFNKIPQYVCRASAVVSCVCWLIYLIQKIKKKISNGKKESIFGGFSVFKIAILLTDWFQNEPMPASTASRSMCCERMRTFWTMESVVQRVKLLAKNVKFWRVSHFLVSEEMTYPKLKTKHVRICIGVLNNNVTNRF